MKNQSRANLVVLAALSACMFAATPADAAGILYLNRCAAPCAYISGPDNSCLHQTSIIGGSHSLAASNYDDSYWNTLVSCVTSVLDPFDVTITTTEPACGSGYWEIAVSGASENLGLTIGLESVSPFTCAQVPNAPGFVFANAMADPLLACWKALQVFGFLQGADRVFDIRDPMTDGDGCLVQRFTATPLPCTGQVNPGLCCTGAPTQTSQALLFGLLGKRPGGAVFSDGFEAWNSGSAQLTGSACHWDQALASAQ